MLGLATTALDALLEERGPMKTAVLGFGDMGMKAVEELLKANQTDIMVVSRDPVVSAKRAPHLAAKGNMISYKIWHEGNQNPDLIISTIRNATATYNERRRLPINVPTTIMDFSWPPSFDESGISDNHTLLGMAHWIKVSHNLGKEWDYIATIASESIIDDIQERYMGKLESKTQKKFRLTFTKHWRGCQNLGRVSACECRRCATNGCFFTRNCNMDLSSIITFPSLFVVRVRSKYGARTEFLHPCICG